MTQQFDVAIVGYGPVGATLANLLGLYGCRTVVLEQDQDIFPIPRAVHMDAETMRIFQFLGLYDALQPALGVYHKREYFNAKGEIFFETIVGQSVYGHPQDIYFHQPMLEAVLREGVARFNHVEIRLGVAVEQATQNLTGLSLAVRDLAKQTTETIEAKYVIGCDGARSFIRKQFNFELRDLGFDQPWLVVDVYLKEGVTAEMANIPNCHRQYCNPQQPITFVPTSVKGHYRWEFMQHDKQVASVAEAPENVHELLSRVVDPEKVDIVRSVVYAFHALVAKQWRKQNVFIAGDAAHQMPPFAGQGMCSGLRDVHNLSWKLALVLAGTASESLLDTYVQERIPHVTRMTRGTMLLGNLIQTRHPIRAFLRDVLFKTILRIPTLFGKLARFTLRSPDLQQGVLGGNVPDAKGTLFIQPVVKPFQSHTQEAVLLDEVLGCGFAVLGLNQSAKTWAHMAKLSTVLTIPITFVQIVGNDTPEQALKTDITIARDVEGLLTAWFQEYSADLVVVRPDRYVFGAYTSASVSEAVDELLVSLFISP